MFINSVFISVLNEKGDYNFLTIDMGILKEYRSKGIGKEVLEIILANHYNSHINKLKIKELL